MEILRGDRQLETNHTSNNGGIIPWQLRVSLLPFLVGAEVTALEIAQRFSDNISTVEAHEINCLGGVNVNDARPGTVVEIIDQKTGKLVVKIPVDATRRGSARWPVGQKSNGETGSQLNQHVLSVSARVPGLSDALRDMPCDGKLWGITVPETTGTNGKPVVVPTPEKSPTPSQTPAKAATPAPEKTATVAPATATPRATETPVPTVGAGATPRVETSPTTGTTPAVSPAQPFNLPQAIKDLANNVSAYAGGIGDISKAWAPQTEKEAAVKEVASLKSKVDELEKDGKTSKEELAKAKEALERAQKESEDKSKLGLAGLGVGILGLIAAGGIGLFAWAKGRRRHEEPAAPAGGEPAADDGAEPAPAVPPAPATPVGPEADGGPAHEDPAAH